MGRRCFLLLNSIHIPYDYNEILIYPEKQYPGELGTAGTTGKR